MGHSSGVGIPDGDQRMQIVRDFRFRYVLKPDAAGKLTFMVGYTPYGVLHQLAGSDHSLKRTTPNSSDPTGWNTWTNVTSSSGMFFEDIVGDLREWRNSSYKEHRLVSLLATATFTGSHMNNQGSLTTRNVNVIDGDERYMATSTAQNAVVSVRPEYTGFTLNGSTLVGPARDTYSARIHPRDRKYYPISSGYAEPNVRSPFACVPSTAGSIAAPVTDAPFALFNYEGLAPDASITLDVSVCNQCIVSPSAGTLMPLAKPALPSDVTLLDRAVNFLSTSSHVRRGAALASNALLNSALRYVGGESVRAAIMDH